MPTSNPTWDETIAADVPKWEETTSEDIKPGPELSRQIAADWWRMPGADIGPFRGAAIGPTEAQKEEAARIIGSLQEPAFRIPRLRGETLPGKLGAAAVNVLGGIGESFLSPVGLASLPLFASKAAPIVKGVYGGLAAEEAGRALGEASVTKDPQAIAEAALGAGMAGLITIPGSFPDANLRARTAGAMLRQAAAKPIISPEGVEAFALQPGIEPVVAPVRGGAPPGVTMTRPADLLSVLDLTEPKGPIVPIPGRQEGPGRIRLPRPTVPEGPIEPEPTAGELLRPEPQSFQDFADYLRNYGTPTMTRAAIQGLFPRAFIGKEAAGDLARAAWGENWKPGGQYAERVRTEPRPIPETGIEPAPREGEGRPPMEPGTPGEPEPLGPREGPQAPRPPEVPPVAPGVGPKEIRQKVDYGKREVVKREGDLYDDENPDDLAFELITSDTMTVSQAKRKFGKDYQPGQTIVSQIMGKPGGKQAIVIAHIIEDKPVTPKAAPQAIADNWAKISNMPPTMFDAWKKDIGKDIKAHQEALADKMGPADIAQAEKRLADMADQLRNMQEQIGAEKDRAKAQALMENYSTYATRFNTVSEIVRFAKERGERKLTPMPKAGEELISVAPTPATPTAQRARIVGLLERIEDVDEYGKVTERDVPEEDWPDITRAAAAVLGKSWGAVDALDQTGLRKALRARLGEIEAAKAAGREPPAVPTPMPEPANLSLARLRHDLTETDATPANLLDRLEDLDSHNPGHIPEALRKAGQDLRELLESDEWREDHPVQKAFMDELRKAVLPGAEERRPPEPPAAAAAPVPKPTPPTAPPTAKAEAPAMGRLGRYAQDDTSTEAKLFSALHGIQDAELRWAKLQETGATDAELKAAIGYEFGTQGGASMHGGYAYRGGTNPRLYSGVSAHGTPLLQGKALISAVRELLKIPEPVKKGEPPPTGVPVTKPTPPVPTAPKAAKKLTAAERRNYERAGYDDAEINYIERRKQEGAKWQDIADEVLAQRIKKEPAAKAEGPDFSELDKIAEGMGYFVKGKRKAPTLAHEGKELLYVTPPMPKNQLDHFADEAGKKGFVQTAYDDAPGKKRIGYFRAPLTESQQKVAELEKRISRLEMLKDFNPEKAAEANAEIAKLRAEIAALEKPTPVAETINQAKIAQLKRQLAAEQKALDKNVAKMGTMVPPPIVAEITRKIADRMAIIQDEIDKFEKLEPEAKPAAPTPKPAEAPPVDPVAQIEKNRHAEDLTRINASMATITDGPSGDAVVKMIESAGHLTDAERSDLTRAAIQAKWDAVRKFNPGAAFVGERSPTMDALLKAIGKEPGESQYRGAAMGPAQYDYFTPPLKRSELSKLILEAQKFGWTLRSQTSVDPAYGRGLVRGLFEARKDSPVPDPLDPLAPPKKPTAALPPGITPPIRPPAGPGRMQIPPPVEVQGELYTFKPEDIKRANLACRVCGAVGAGAITPQYVIKTAAKTEAILDFGAGDRAPHVKMLRDKGFNVTAYEFGENVVPGVHDTEALSRKYDTVYASNVLNVQASREMLRATLQEIRQSTGTRAIFNYPRKPRYSTLRNVDVENEIKNIFGVAPVRVGGTKDAPIWEVRLDGKKPGAAVEAAEPPPSRTELGVVEQAIAAAMPDVPAATVEKGVPEAKVTPPISRGPPPPYDRPEIRAADERAAGLIAENEARRERLRQLRKEADALSGKPEQAAKVEEHDALVKEINDAVEEIGKATAAAKDARQAAWVEYAKTLPPPEPREPVTGPQIAEQKSNLLDQVNAALKQAPERPAGVKTEDLPKVTISVPGDGEWSIYNTKEALTDFRNKVQKEFPRGVGAAKGPGLPSGRPTQPPKAEFPTGTAKKPLPEALGEIAGAFVSKDESRYVITGSYADGTQIIATDGRRLLRIVTSDAPGAVDKPVRLNEKGKATEIEGNFPDWRNVMSDKPDLAVGGVDTSQLWNVATQVLPLFKDTKANPILKLFINRDGSVGATAENVGVGEYSHNVKEGARSLGIFNAEYLQDAAAAARRLGDEKVDIYFHGIESGPMEIRGSKHQTLLQGINLATTGTDMQRAKTFAPSSRVHGELPPGLGPLADPESAMQSFPSGAAGKFPVTLKAGEFTIEKYSKRAREQWRGGGTEDYVHEIGKMPLDQFLGKGEAAIRANVTEAMKGAYSEGKVPAAAVQTVIKGMREAAQMRDKIIREGKERVEMAGKAKLTDRLDKAADAALKRIRDRGEGTTFGSGPLHELPNIRDYAIYGAAKLAKLGLKGAEWTAAMIKEFGPRIRPFLGQIYTLAKEELARYQAEMARPPGAPTSVQAAIEQGQTVPPGPPTPSGASRTIESLQTGLRTVRALRAYFEGGAKVSKAEVKIADDWLEGDARRIKDSLTKLAQDRLPVAERGRFITAINRATERPRLLTGDPERMYERAARVAGAIENWSEEVAKRHLASRLEAALNRALESPSVDILYKARIAKAMEPFALHRLSPRTARSLQGTREHVARLEAAGEDVTVPREVLDKLDLLDKVPVRELSLDALRSLHDSIVFLEELGRQKVKLTAARWEAEKNKKIADLAGEKSRPYEKRELPYRQPSDPKTMYYRLMTEVNKRLNGHNLMDRALLPADALFDMLGDAKGNYDGWLFRHVRGPLDLGWNEAHVMAERLMKPAMDLIKRFQMGEREAERIGVYATAQQEGGRERMIAMGVLPETIDTITRSFSPAEKMVYQAMRKSLDEMLPQLQKLMHELYNIDVVPVENYWPMPRDWSLVAKDAKEFKQPKFGETIELDELAGWKEMLKDFLPGRTTRTERGMTIERVPQAETAIKLNAFDVFYQHVNDAAYLLKTQRDLKMIGEIVRGDLFKEKYGDLGRNLVIDWLDTFARQGRLGGFRRAPWLDEIRRRTSAGVIGFRLSSQFVHASNIPLAIYHTGGVKYYGAGLAMVLRGEAAEFLAKHFKEAEGWQSAQNKQFLRDNFAETFVRGGAEPALVEAAGLDPRSMLPPGVGNQFVRAGFYIARLIDRLNSQATVMGAYFHELESKGIDASRWREMPIDREAQAMALVRARRAVASPLPKDVPMVLSRGTLFNNISVSRAFFQFQNVFLDQWSNIRHDLWNAGIKEKDPVKVAQLSIALMAMLAAETGIRTAGKAAVAATAVAIGGTIAEKKREESIEEKLVVEAVRRFPFGGQATTIALYGGSGIPVMETFEEMIKSGYKTATLPVGTAQDRAKIRLIGSALQAAGVPGSSQAADILQRAQ